MSEGTKGKVGLFAILAGFAGLFFLGQLVGVKFAAENDDRAGAAPSKSARGKPVWNQVLAAGGVSLFVAEREGFSESAQRLVALYDSSNGGGVEFVEALVALEAGELDRLVQARNLVYRWARRNATAAAAYVAALPVGQARDRAAEILVKEWGKTNPGVALQHQTKRRHPL